MQQTDNDTSRRFTLRMDSELFELIALEARKNRRSTAKEFEVAVAQYLDGIGSSKYKEVPTCDCRP